MNNQAERSVKITSGIFRQKSQLGKEEQAKRAASTSMKHGQSDEKKA